MWHLGITAGEMPGVGSGSGVYTREFHQDRGSVRADLTDTRGASRAWGVPVVQSRISGHFRVYFFLCPLAPSTGVEIDGSFSYRSTNEASVGIVIEGQHQRGQHGHPDRDPIKNGGLACNL